jgi:transposase
MDANTVDKIRTKYHSLSPFLNERIKRLWVGAEAKAIGRGGKLIVAEATGVSRMTIDRGIRELEKFSDTPFIDRIRLQGGGRKRLIVRSPEVLEELKSLIEGTTRGDPESPLLWTCKSTRQLEQVLRGQGYNIGRQKISELLDEIGYSLQGN